jgi:hypothetical protein
VAHHEIHDVAALDRPGERLDGRYGTRDYKRRRQPDILWRNVNSQQLVLWYMDGPLLVSGQLLSTPSLADVNWKVVGPR